MAKDTHIEWCDSTLNLMMGCDGCELWNRKTGNLHCYAGALTDRYGGSNAGFPAQFEVPVMFPARLQYALDWPDLTGKKRRGKPWLDGMPRLIFLDDMGDTFTESLPLDWIAPHLPAMAASPHQFLMLTKRPKRMAEFSKSHPLPVNVWPGTSITKVATVPRAYELAHVIGGGPRWLSVEPLLEGITLAELLEVAKVKATGQWDRSGFKSLIDWLILGGESGGDARPLHPHWESRLREECEAAGVPYFFKQWGAWVPWSPAADDRELMYMADDGRRFETNANVGSASIEPMVLASKKTAGRRVHGREYNGMPSLNVKGLLFHGA